MVDPGPRVNKGSPRARHRVAYRSRNTPRINRGSWLNMQLSEMERMTADLNRRHEGLIQHWVEVEGQSGYPATANWSDALDPTRGMGRFRVVHAVLRTGQTASGSWLDYPLPVMERMVDDLNRTHEGVLHHWLENEENPDMYYGGFPN